MHVILKDSKYLPKNKIFDKIIKNKLRKIKNNKNKKNKKNKKIKKIKKNKITKKNKI